VQAKIVYAGSNNTSYQQAEADLRELAELRVCGKQVRRVCKQIGTERCAERDAEAAEYQAKPLMDRKDVPEGVTAPDLAVVGTDGGRLQIFERSAAAEVVTAAAANTARLRDTKHVPHPTRFATASDWWYIVGGQLLRNATP